ncbi:hypothetical protein SAMN04487950_4359 [Halogranum rubrum]|uniref:Uncharacterized protein n=1 Tax=Halogranum rubrum TaxID=553466 RepID=A0A1I4J2R4_9EURY|nr:hypothetical protein [Halogranum rubrum]SFL60912.1 hypothetical protein SAMN04487950_4359 [Halogranum rubrum]
MRLALHLSLALLLACAGCSAAPGVGPSESTMTQQPTATPAAPPAGLSMERVTDARSLTESHSSVLDDASYTVDLRRVVRYENGTVLSRTNVTHRVGANGRAWYQTRADGTRPLFLGGSTGGVEHWENESVSVSKVTQDGDSVYRRGLHRGRPASFSTVYSISSSFDLTTTGRTGGGAETRYHLTSAEPTETRAFGIGREPARNATLTAAVDGDGVLRHYELRYKTVFRNETLQVTQTMRVSDIGETTVPRPEWVDTALDETRDRVR